MRRNLTTEQGKPNKLDRPELKVWLPDVVGAGYGRFWSFTGRYRVVKGGRGSKKSKTTALNMIVRLMQYPAANLLVVRRTYRTLKDSCFAELKWAIHRLGVDAWWDMKESPLEMTYRPTGQKILFRGLDDPLKVTSVTVDVGVLCWMWLEEAYEIANRTDFDILDESIRGEVPEGYFKQITLTFNPWNAHHWLKRRFFDVAESPNILAMTTNYTCNEWLDENDRELFEQMKRENPKRYKVAGLGEWGAADGLVFENVNIRAITDGEIVQFDRIYHGVDWGYFPDPWAYNRCYYDAARRKLYIFDELTMYKAGNLETARALMARGIGRSDEIIADSAEPKSVQDYRQLGLMCRGAAKGAGSVDYSMKWLQALSEIVIDAARCPDTANEFLSYEYEKARDGEFTAGYPDRNNHHIDAVRYALNRVWRTRGQ